MSIVCNQTDLFLNLFIYKNNEKCAMGSDQYSFCYDKPMKRIDFALYISAEYWMAVWTEPEIREYACMKIVNGL